MSKNGDGVFERPLFLVCQEEIFTQGKVWLAPSTSRAIMEGCRDVRIVRLKLTSSITSHQDRQNSMLFDQDHNHS